ncbi:hypothetical protein OH77DRAFT_349946 [Trametes cingulata]|nr:hypothetical protein OH77DRAFT_349946 [Trametes cingulata]
MRSTLGVLSNKEASPVLRSDDPLEPRLGDTLLFCRDPSQPGRTLIISAHTRLLYHTLVTEEGNGRCYLFRGVADSLDTPDALLAVVSIARKPRLATASKIFSSLRANITFNSSNTLQTKSSSTSGKDSESTPCDAAHLTEKPDENDGEAHPKCNVETSQRTSMSNDLDVMMITYGDAAPAYLKRCIKLGKHPCVHLSHERVIRANLCA